MCGGREGNPKHMQQENAAGCRGGRWRQRRPRADTSRSTCGCSISRDAAGCLVGLQRVYEDGSGEELPALLESSVTVREACASTRKRHAVVRSVRALSGVGYARAGVFGSALRGVGSSLRGVWSALRGGGSALRGVGSALR
eukprot:5262278-Pleurochrysis_carterae.AAC.1